MLSFEQFRGRNQARCAHTFNMFERAPEWWSNAMAGEAGEVCNITKKLSRLVTGFGGRWNKIIDQTEEALIARLKREIGDVVIYADLLATRMGLTFEDCVRTAFNEKSVEIESDIRLGE